MPLRTRLSPLKVMKLAEWSSKSWNGTRDERVHFTTVSRSEAVVSTLHRDRFESKFLVRNSSDQTAEMILWSMILIKYRVERAFICLRLRESSRFLFLVLLHWRQLQLAPCALEGEIVYNPIKFTSVNTISSRVGFVNVYSGKNFKLLAFIRSSMSFLLKTK